MIELSIIVPVYNVGEYLHRCLDSIVNQTVSSQIEIILINDGSIDGSGEICDLYASKYHYVTVIHQINSGVSSARNRGISNATGEFVAFVDADDYVELDFYEKMLSLAKLHESDIVINDYWLDFDDGRLVKYRNITKEKKWEQVEAIKEFLSGGLIGVNLFDKIFRRKVVGYNRFDERIRIGEDLYFVFQCLLNSNIVYGKFEPGYHYYQREGSAMKTSFNEKYFDVIEVSNRIKDIVAVEFNELVPFAEALYIHSVYKTLERAYKFKSSDIYKQRLEICSDTIKKYRCLDAKKYLSFKQFTGFCLIKFSPRLYLYTCKLMRI